MDTVEEILTCPLWIEQKWVTFTANEDTVGRTGVNADRKSPGEASCKSQCTKYTEVSQVTRTHAGVYTLCTKTTR